jgi:hypothetical protein
MAIHLGSLREATDDSQCNAICSSSSDHWLDLKAVILNVLNYTSFNHRL